MAGNTFGALFRLTTFGESHGVAIGGVIDGCPPRLPIDVDDIQRDLDRRRPGASKYVTQRNEPDRVEVLSGVMDGLSTGAPIALLIYNQDAKPKDYGNLVDVFRPGHADYTYWQKYGIRDHRGGGRSSARETAARVAGGAIARALLRHTCGVVVRGYLSQMDDIVVPFNSWDDTADNPFFTANRGYEAQLAERIAQLRKAGDSCGAVIEVVAENAPAGLGEPVFDRLDADIAKAMMSINAVKGVEIGAGFAAASMRGSAHNDAIGARGFAGNNAGGVLGGISTGQAIRARIAVKPTASIPQPQRTIDRAGNDATVTTKGRHDPCVGIRAVPIAEAMLCLTLADHLLRQRAIGGDVGGGGAI